MSVWKPTRAEIVCETADGYYCTIWIYHQQVHSHCWRIRRIDSQVWLAMHYADSLLLAQQAVEKELMKLREKNL